MSVWQKYNIQVNDWDSLLINKFIENTKSGVFCDVGACNGLFTSLNLMKNKIDSLEFDISLVGCGAYGLPIGSYIKNHKKKSAIHLGGSLQILFGIIGNRWVSNQRIMRFFNEHWTRPIDSERIINFNTIEGGCYW